MNGKKDMDIIKNVKTIEWLKSELLSSVAYLYQELSQDEDYTKESISDIVSNIILLSFLLSRRLGLNYKDVISDLEDKIKLNISQEHKIEKWYGDLSQLIGILKEV